MIAVRLVRSGIGVRAVSRKFGYVPSTISKWVKRAESLPSNAQLIPTRTSRPHHHPHALSSEVVRLILSYRGRHKRCAKVIQYLLVRDGVEVSLSSVERVLRKYQLVNHSPWKKWYRYPERPLPEKPGMLVQIDTIHEQGLIQVGGLYVYSMLDVCSRYGFAEVRKKANTHQSIAVVMHAREMLPFSIQMLQSDHGAEFSKFFTKRVSVLGFAHRHSRVRKPNDNAHLERFNRTLREECLERLPKSFKIYQKEIPEYLNYYNTKRPHMSLKMKSPIDIINT